MDPASVAEGNSQAGGLADDGVVGGETMRDQVPRADAAAAVEGALVAVDGGALRLADDGGHEQVAPQPHAGLLQRPDRLVVGGKGRLHVRGADPIDPVPIAAGARLVAGPQALVVPGGAG